MQTPITVRNLTGVPVTLLINTDPHGRNIGPNKKFEPETGQHLTVEFKPSKRTILVDGVSVPCIGKREPVISELPKPQPNVILLVPKSVLQQVPDRSDLAAPGDAKKDPRGPSGAILCSYLEFAVAV